MTVTNDLLDRLNRIYYGKLSGGLASTELSEELIKVGDLIANCIRNGKISNIETIKEMESHLPNSKFFKFNHEELSKAVKTFIEGNAFALSERESRFTVSAHQKIMHNS